MLPATRKKPKRVIGRSIQPSAHGRQGAARDWDKPLLRAFALKDEERLVFSNRTARQCHELAGAKSRAVEQLEQGQVTYRLWLPAGRSVFGCDEHRLNFGLLENPR